MENFIKMLYDGFCNLPRMKFCQTAILHQDQTLVIRMSFSNMAMRRCSHVPCRAHLVSALRNVALVQLLQLVQLSVQALFRVHLFCLFYFALL